MQAESAATTGSHLTWLDLLLAATLSLAAFGAGGLVQPALSIPFSVQVEPRVLYDARHGVLTRRDELAIIEARQTKLRERIASEYVALAADSGSKPADGRTRLIRSLESEAETLATR